MQVLIIGAGEVGSGIAIRLTASGHEVSVIDTNASVLGLLQERADIQVINGDGTSPRVLKKAGMESSDMIVAVSNSDQVNMIACLLAGTFRNNPIKIARIENEEYEYNTNVLEKGGLNLDLVINQDKEATKVILDLVKYPHTVYFASFFSGRVYCIAFVIRSGQIDILMRAHTEGLEKRGWMPILVDRNGHWSTIIGHSPFVEGDVVYCLLQQEEGMGRFYDDVFGGYTPPRRIMVLGGNELGFSVVKRLEREGYQTKLIEQDRNRCFELAERLQHTVILNGQGSDESLLREENISAHDLFVAAEADEETNILSCLLAKRLGVSRVIALSSKISYLPLLARIGIDVSISPRLIAVKKIVAFIRSERISQIEIIGDGTYELVEVEILDSDEVCGQSLSGITFPEGVKPLALWHFGDMVLNLQTVILQPKDKLLFLLPSRHLSTLIQVCERGN